MEPAGRLEPQPWMAAPEVRAVLAAIQTGGLPRFVGGCVRDSLLGRPFREVDIATDTHPGTVSSLLERAGITPLPVGIDHGTVGAFVGGRSFEITTLRVDIEPLGRRARVAFTDDWAADAERRDFTMNALYADPDGTLYDPTGGRRDLEAGRVRFVGSPGRRIAEDSLRILRFFRFHAHYGRSPADTAALQACRLGASGLARLSAERIAAELLRLLEASDPAPVLGLMSDGGVLQRVLPEATNRRRLERLSLRDVDDADALLRLAAVLDVDSEGAAAVSARLRLSNRDRDRLVRLAKSAPIRPDAADGALRRRLYRSGREAFRDRALLSWAEEDVGASGWPRVLSFSETWSPPAFPLTGDDALALGLRGTAVGDSLRAVEDWWVAQDFAPDRDACRARLRAHASSATHRRRDG